MATSSRLDDLLDHFDAIRTLQDEHAGFTAFVPWSFKPGNTLLEKWIKHYKGPSAYLRMLAVSRLYLDNFPHIQASWFSEGKQAGQVALHFGADDDWGGTLFEENVHKAAAYVNTITVEEKNRRAHPRSRLHPCPSAPPNTRSWRATSPTPVPPGDERASWGRGDRVPFGSA